MTREDALKEARQRWPATMDDVPSGKNDGDISQPWSGGAVKAGLIPSVGVAFYEWSNQFDEFREVRFEVKGFGNTWEAAFLDAERRGKGG